MHDTLTIKERNLTTLYQQMNAEGTLEEYLEVYGKKCRNTFLTLSAHAREGYSSHCQLSVSLSLFDFGEGAVFRVETNLHQYILGDD